MERGVIKASPNTVCFLKVAATSDMPNNIAWTCVDASSSYVTNEKSVEEILIEGGETSQR
jgi:hypothetical protein